MRSSTSSPRVDAALALLRKLYAGLGARAAPSPALLLPATSAPHTERQRAAPAPCSTPLSHQPPRRYLTSLHSAKLGPLTYLTSHVLRGARETSLVRIGNLSPVSNISCSMSALRRRSPAQSHLLRRSSRGVRPTRAYTAPPSLHTAHEGRGGAPEEEAGRAADETPAPTTASRARGGGCATDRRHADRRRPRGLQFGGGAHASAARIAASTRAGRGSSPRRTAIASASAAATAATAARAKSFCIWPMR